jgi:hypothetical protein
MRITTTGAGLQTTGMMLEFGPRGAQAQPSLLMRMVQPLIWLAIPNGQRILVLWVSGIRLRGRDAVINGCLMTGM